MVRYLKRLKSSKLGRVQAFAMYGGLGMSAPSLHRESTDSLIVAVQESWEKEDSKIDIDGYKWFGKPRSSQRSQRGEGGVGFVNVW